MAQSRLFPAPISTIFPIPFIPAKISLNQLYSDKLLLIKDDLLAVILGEYENAASVGLHMSSDVADRISLYPDEASDLIYDILVRDELIGNEQEIAVYAVCKDDQKLGEGAFGKVLPVQRLNGDNKGAWFALKVVTVQDKKQLPQILDEEQTLVDLDRATPSSMTPRSSRSEASFSLEQESLVEDIPVKAVRGIRKTTSSRVFTTGSEGSPIESNMQRSGSVKIFGSQSRSNVMKLTKQSPGSTASSPIVPTHLSSSPKMGGRGRSTSSVVPTLAIPKLKLGKSSDTLPDIMDVFEPLSRPGSPLLVIDLNDISATNSMRYEYDIFMDLVNGESLQRMFDRESKLDVCISDVLRMQMAIDCADELANLINLNRIHCDIKPQNVIYDQFMQKAHFIDFGDSRQLHPISRQCISDQYNGTWVYMAPELRREVMKSTRGQQPNFLANEKTEVYALGILIADIFNLHSETAPDIESEAAYIQKSYEVDQTDVSSVLEYHVWELICRATVADPAARISLRELRLELKSCMEKYVDNKKIGVCAFDVHEYLLSAAEQRDVLFNQAVKDCQNYFDELWLMDLRVSTASSRDYVELRRRFEEASVVVGDYVAIGKTIPDALKGLKKHLKNRKIKSDVQSLQLIDEKVPVLGA